MIVQSVMFSSVNGKDMAEQEIPGAKGCDQGVPLCLSDPA